MDAKRRKLRREGASSASFRFLDPPIKDILRLDMSYVKVLVSMFGTAVSRDRQ